MSYTKEEIKKNRTILLATLQYLLEYHSMDMVLDGYSPSRQWYLSEISQTKLDIEKSRSAQIRRRLDIHLSILRSRFDLGLDSYVKEKTGYDLDIFSEFKTQVLPIIARGSMGDNDIYLVENYLRAYGANAQEKENVDLLKALLAGNEAKINRLIGLRDVVGFTTSGRSEKGKWLLYEETAPNGIFSLAVQISGKGAQALTYVTVGLPGGEGGVYGAMGEELPIRAYWKNDHCIIIETKEDYEKAFKYSQVNSYADGVSIEYRFA